MASVQSHKFHALLLQKNIDVIADTLKLILLGSAYVPLQSHAFVSDLVASELSGTGYTAGFGNRIAVTSKSINTVDGSAAPKFTCANVVLAGLSVGTIGAIALVKEITNDVSSPIICIADIVDVVTNGTEWDINWLASGVFDLG
jgi:hypothetical protein